MESPKIRIDFKTEEFEWIDKEKGLYRMRMVPDPDRYEKRTINGEEGYFDKSDGSFLPTKVIAEAARHMVGLPIYAPRPTIKSLPQYFGEARKRIGESLVSEVDLKPEEDRGNAYLKINLGKKLLLVVLYIDIVKSTQLFRVLSDVAQRTLTNTFAREMSLIVDGLGGYVHKYNGDGIIAFFPAEHNFTGTTDSAVDCGILMKSFILKVLNPILRPNRYPPLQFRIGIDSGETQIVGMGAKKIKSTIDLLGYTMHIAAKICATCRPNQLIIGESAFRTLHISRKKLFKEERRSKREWSYLDANTNRVYRLFGFVG